MLNDNDVILVSVVGTEGQSRATKHVSKRFDYKGRAVDNQGRETGEASLDLGALQGGGEVKIPDFPQAEFQRAQRNGDFAQVAQINLDYAKALQEATRQGGGAVGGGVQGLYKAIARSVVKYLCRYENFTDDEARAERGIFLLKAENVEITPTKVNGSVIYTVSGTAVFGRE